MRRLVARHGGHHNGNGADNNGVNDYAGDNGAKDGYGNDVNGAGDSYGDEGRSAQSAEASPVGGLTKGFGGVGTTSLGGLNLLKTLG